VAASLRYRASAQKLKQLGKYESSPSPPVEVSIIGGGGRRVESRIRPSPLTRVLHLLLACAFP